MARRSGKYTVGLPRPGPNPEEIWRRWVYVVQTFGAQLAQNYLRGIQAAANSPALAQQVIAKLREWYAAFFGTGVPAAYRRAITPAIEQYRARRAALVGAPPAAVAPARIPAPPPAAVAPA